MILMSNLKRCLDLEGGRGYWAPDISYYKGRFYITATYRLNDTGNVYRKQIVVSSDKPEGPYSKPAIIDEDGIDPAIFMMMMEEDICSLTGEQEYLSLMRMLLNRYPKQSLLSMEIIREHRKDLIL